MVVAVVGMLLVVSCSSSKSASGGAGATTTGRPATTLSAARQVSPAGTYVVGHATRTFVDASRPTDAHGGRPAETSRTLVTLILYPAADSPRSTDTVPDPTSTGPLPGPWPVIIFGHGSTRKPDDYAGTLAYWASAGYVVVAPAFPLSTEGTPGGTAYGDYPNQSGDESFLIDQLSSDDAAPLHLASLVDADRIGIGGQSFGAITALGTVAAECCADERVKAATSFAGAWLPYPGSKDALAPWAHDVPVLFFHGDADPTLPYDGDHTFFERLGAPGGFVTLVGSGHDPGFFDGAETPLDRLVSQSSLAFYDQYLKGGPDAGPIIAGLVKSAGPKVARFEPAP